jgi:putative ABC transport system ATP-binding protein
MLKAQGLRSVRDGQQILANVDVIVEPGESLAVTGPSGSGKTTLLSLLSGLARPTAGEVYIDGQPLTRFAGPALGVAVVLQGYGLVSLLTAAENIEVAMRAAGRSPAVATRAAREMLAHLGLEAHADQLVEELSGGQQQRTAVARALALEPRLLIADEPTAELDPAARAVALARMFEVALNGGSLILATHDPEVADRCDRILDLSEGSPATGSPPGQAAVDQPPPDPVPASPAPPDQAGADQLSAARPAIELSTLRPLAAEPRAPADRPAEEPPAADDLPADQASPGQLPAEQPPLHQAAPDQQDREGPGRRPAPWHKPAHALPPAAEEDEVSSPAPPPAWPQPHPDQPGPGVTPGHQLPPAVPPEGLSAQRERLISSALPPMHRRGARLRSYLDEVRRRAYQASAWLDARDRQAQQAGSAGLSPAADAGAGERELLRLARDDLAGFADLGLRLLELHQPMDLGAGTGDLSSSVPRCLTCMWRWPCPTFLTLAEIVEHGPGPA